MKKLRNVLCLLLAIILFVQDPTSAFAKSKFKTIKSSSCSVICNASTNTKINGVWLTAMQGMAVDNENNRVYYVKQDAKNNKYAQISVADLTISRKKRKTNYVKYYKDGSLSYLTELKHANDMCYAKIGDSRYLFVVTAGDKSDSYGIVRLKLETVNKRERITEATKISVKCGDSNIVPSAIAIYSNVAVDATETTPASDITLLLKKGSSIYTAPYKDNEDCGQTSLTAEKLTEISTKTSDKQKYKITGEGKVGYKYQGMEYDMATQTLYVPIWNQTGKKNGHPTGSGNRILVYSLAPNEDGKISAGRPDLVYKVSSGNSQKYEVETCAIRETENGKYLYLAVDIDSKDGSGLDRVIKFELK